MTSSLTMIALGLAEREFITVEEAREGFGRLTELRGIHDWRPAVRMTPWTAATEGHMLSAQLRAARQHTMIIADKTIANVMAYAWLVLHTPPGSREAAVRQPCSTR